jgi:hypothetical protein
MPGYTLPRSGQNSPMWSAKTMQVPVVRVVTQNSCTAFWFHIAVRQLPTPIQQGHHALVAMDIPTSGLLCMSTVVINCKAKGMSFRDI